VLRSEAEDEFRQMCLEFPQFGYDVLSKFFFFSPPPARGIARGIYMCVDFYANMLCPSSCSGRETQERQERQDASYGSGKLEEETAAEWDLEGFGMGERVWKWEWHLLHEVSWCMNMSKRWWGIVVGLETIMITSTSTNICFVLFQA
jgi:hypothetical protein